MAGILEEGSDLLEEDGDDAVPDAAFIAGCQRTVNPQAVSAGAESEDQDEEKDATQSPRSRRRTA
jgi:hypothetical protein